VPTGKQGNTHAKPWIGFGRVPRQRLLNPRRNFDGRCNFDFMRPMRLTKLPLLFAPDCMERPM
jgi:hypothetical protein